MSEPRYILLTSFNFKYSMCAEQKESLIQIIQENQRFLIFTLENGYLRVPLLAHSVLNVLT